MRATRRHATWAFGLALVLSAAASLSAAGTVAFGGESLLLADFRGETPTTFPSYWKTRADTAEASRVYTVVSGDGRQYLHAAADADSV